MRPDSVPLYDHLGPCSLDIEMQVARTQVREAYRQSCVLLGAPQTEVQTPKIVRPPKVVGIQVQQRFVGFDRLWPVISELVVVGENEEPLAICRVVGQFKGTL